MTRGQRDSRQCKKMYKRSPLGGQKEGGSREVAIDTAYEQVFDWD